MLTSDDCCTGVGVVIPADKCFDCRSCFDVDCRSLVCRPTSCRPTSWWPWPVWVFMLAVVWAMATPSSRLGSVVNLEIFQFFCRTKFYVLCRTKCWMFLFLHLLRILISLYLAHEFDLVIEWEEKELKND